MKNMRKKTPKTGADLPPARAWQRMLSGRRLDLVDPSPMDIEIEDIAHRLSRVARWNGQTSGGHIFSVAQHSLLVEAIASQTGRQMSQGWRLATLLHDAPEYVIGDMISPFKNALGVDYRAFEERLQRAIHIRFGLPPVLDPDLKRRIKEADKMAAWLEATALAGFSEEEALRIFGPKPDVRCPLPAPMDAESCKREFLKKFAELEGQ